ncbi:MAG TPA: methyltransferase domain-containing protein [Herpetosiphonaceae bacterium]
MLATGQHNSTADGDARCIPAPTPETQAFLDEREQAVDLQWLQLERGMRVLDLGCGTGGITRQIARAVQPARVLGIDASPAQLGFAVRHAIADGVANVDFVCDDACHPQLPPESFDVVVCHTLLMYLDTPAAALARQRQLVVPGGMVAALSEGDWGTVAIYPPSEHLQQCIDVLCNHIRRSGGDPEIGRKLPRLFRAAGFQHVEVAEAAPHATVLSGRDLAHGTWLAPLLGVLTAAARHGLIAPDAIDEVTAGVTQWCQQPDSLVILPCTVKARAWR